MKVISLTKFTAVITTTYAAPVAIAEANAYALAQPVAAAIPLPYASAIANSAADARAFAAANPQAIPLDFDLSRADNGFNELTTYLNTLKTLLNGGNLPQLNIESLLTLVVGIINPVLDIVGESLGDTTITDLLKKYASDSVAPLGELAKTNGVDAALDPALGAAMTQYSQVLIDVINLTLDLLPNIQSEDLVGAGFVLIHDGPQLLRDFREASGN